MLNRIVVDERPHFVIYEDNEGVWFVRIFE